MPRPKTCLLAALALLGPWALGRAQLPPVPVPPENPLTAAKVVLGKILFWDEQLSSNDSVACGTCHFPEAGGGDPRLHRVDTPVHPGADRIYGTDDDVRGSPGVVRTGPQGDFAADPLFGLHTQVTGRLASPAVGAAHHTRMFWDGRASPVFTDPETNQVLIGSGGALESQAIGPILSPVEMGHDGRTWADLRQKLATAAPLLLATNLPADVAAALQQHATYPGLFGHAFGDPAITAARIAFAIASYERTLIPDQTPWDRFMNGDPTALTPNQQLGWSLFQGAGRCTNCHTTPLFTDDLFHNLGLRPWAEDPGLMATTGVMADRGAFKTPTLRNAGLRGRMLHNGSMPALGSPEGVTALHSFVNLYFFGGGLFRDNLDPLLLPLQNLGVTKADLRLVEDFVQVGLTDPRAAQGLPPFDHPTLRSVRTAALRYGLALPGSSGEAPFLVDPDPAYPGNLGFRMGMSADQPGSLGLLVWSLFPAVPPLWVAGIPVSIGLPYDARFFVMGGSPGGPGHFTWPVPIPPVPGLAGLDVHFQFLTADPLVVTGVAASSGLLIPLR